MISTSVAQLLYPQERCWRKTISARAHQKSHMHKRTYEGICRPATDAAEIL
jgi:hypothetical protein